MNKGQAQNYLENAQKHFEMDKLRAGDYFFDSGEACSVGCHALDLGLGERDIHANLAKAYDLPEWLLHLQDRIFENLEDRNTWHVDIAGALKRNPPLESKFDNLRDRFLSRLLSEVFLPEVGENHTAVIAIIKQVIKLLDNGYTQTEIAYAAYTADAAADAADGAYAAAADAAAYAADAAGGSWVGIKTILLEEITRGKS